MRKNFGCEKHFRVKKDFRTKVFRGDVQIYGWVEIFWVKNIPLSKIFLGQNIFGSKNFLGQNFIGSKKN